MERLNVFFNEAYYMLHFMVRFRQLFVPEQLQPLMLKSWGQIANDIDIANKQAYEIRPEAWARVGLAGEQLELKIGALEYASSEFQQALLGTPFFEPLQNSRSRKPDVFPIPDHFLGRQLRFLFNRLLQYVLMVLSHINSISSSVKAAGGPVSGLVEGIQEFKEVIENLIKTKQVIENDR